jgi:26S proteasome non-ATPase regulatory subunit 10
LYAVTLPRFHLCLINIKDERTALHWAASSGAADVARYLLDLKADVDKADGTGWTALHMAGERSLFDCHPVFKLWNLASAGHEEIVKELIGAGAEVNRQNDKGLTPL